MTFKETEAPPFLARECIIDRGQSTLDPGDVNHEIGVTWVKTGTLKHGALHIHSGTVPSTAMRLSLLYLLTTVSGLFLDDGKRKTH